MCGWSFPSHSQTVYENGIPVEALTNFRLDTLTRTYIWFRHDVGVVDSNYMDNRASLASIRKALSEIDRDSLNAISSILVEGASSPLGHEVYNLRLSYRRAETVADFLRSIPGMGGINIQTVAKGEDWDAFTQDIRDNYQRRNRKELLELLESDLSKWEKKTRLRTMEPDSLTWRILIRDNMNTSRHAVTIVVLKKKRIIDFLPRLKPIEGSLMTGTELVADRTFLQTPTPSPAPSPVPSPAPSSSSSSTESVPQEKESRGEPLLFAFRSNLLVPALNIGAEVPLGERWSVSADYYYPWIWPSKMNRNCFELLGWSVEGRYWFGRDRQPQQRLRGHSVGLYAAAGYYDFERNYQGQQGEFVSTGLDYTYAMGIGRRKRLNLEFTLALGYIRSWGRNYTVPGSGGELYPEPGTVIFDYVGPTKAAVSLVVPFEKWPWTKATMTGKTKAGKSKATRTGRTRKEGRR